MSEITEQEQEILDRINGIQADNKDDFITDMISIIGEYSIADQQQDEFLILPDHGHRKYTYFYDSYTEEQRQEMYKLGFVRVSHEDWNKLMGNLNDGHTYYIADDGRIYDETEYVPTDEEVLKSKTREIYKDYQKELVTDTVYSVDGVDYSFSKTEENIAKFMQAYAVAQLAGENEFNCTVDGKKTKITMSAADFEAVLLQASTEQRTAYAKYKERIAAL